MNTVGDLKTFFGDLTPFESKLKAGSEDFFNRKHSFIKQVTGHSLAKMI